MRAGARAVQLGGELRLSAAARYPRVTNEVEFLGKFLARQLVLERRGSRRHKLQQLQAG